MATVLIPCRVRLVVAGTRLAINGLYVSTTAAAIAALTLHPAATRITAKRVGSAS